MLLSLIGSGNGDPHNPPGWFVPPADVERVADGLETWSWLTFAFLEARTVSRV